MLRFDFFWPQVKFKTFGATERPFEKYWLVIGTQGQTFMKAVPSIGLSTFALRSAANYFTLSLTS